MSDIKVELDRIRERLSDENFLTNKGLSNEVGIHVFCYDPKHELIVRDFITRLTSESSDIFRIIERDMYNIFLSIIEDEDVLDDIPVLESEEGKESLLETLQNIASPDVFLEKMRYEPHEPGKDVLFLTGIGKVHPFMRSHIMLNTMQKAFSDIPIVMFYPGTFNGKDLSLFDSFFDGNYYRAFNLL
ncbi:MAG: DUF1788 domain-containing protein [Oscillospiraceae bacterium]|nr:DUF1788 domain-containing protein [Oscillospiraceae bacterium]